MPLVHQRSILLLNSVHKDIARATYAAFDPCAAAGLPFIVTQGLRTPQEQAALYAQGRTAPGPIVTYTTKSHHLTGHAVDLCILIGGKAIWKVEFYQKLAEIYLQAAKNIGIPVVWGGTFPSPDSDHFELDPDVYGL